MVTIVEKLNEKLPEIFKSTGESPKTLGVACELVLIGVEASAAGKGIGGKMTKLAYSLMKQKGYKFSFAECSSHYSTRALVKAGGKIEHSIKYCDYEVSQGWCRGQKAIFADIPGPHTAINLVVTMLESWSADM